MGDGGHLGFVHIEAVAQADPGRLRHDDHLVRQSNDIVQYGALMGCRSGQDRVGDHDGRDAETGEDLEHLVTVGSSVQAVLVLHHGHVELVQQPRARDHGSTRSVDELADHQIAPRDLATDVDDPHDADLGVDWRPTRSPTQR